MGEVKRERRQKVREMTGLLRSDLYERIPDPEPEKAGGRAVWRSPGGLLCIYGYDGLDPAEPVWCRLVDTRGRTYAEGRDVDVHWLDQEML